MGTTFLDLDEKEKAMDCFKQAVALKPDFVLARGNLALVFEKTHRLDDAEKVAEEALQFDPHAPLANLAAAKSQRRRKNPANALALLTRIPLEICNPSIQADVLNEQGKVYDLLGKYEKAFECFSRSNGVTSRTYSAGRIDKHAFPDKIKRMKSWLTSYPAMPADSPADPQDPKAVFIIGFPRSGTTLLEQILASRSNIRTLEEKPLVAAMINLLHIRNIPYPEALSGLSDQFIRDLRQTYHHKAATLLPEHHEGVFIDKLPLNIVDVGLIYRVFPHAKIILALRHPCDICLSCFMQSFRLNESMVHFLNLEDTVRLYDMVMTLWTCYAQTLPLNLYVIRYEDLVTDFENQTMKLFRFLHIPWDPSVHDFHIHARSKGTITTPSYHQVAEPIYRGSLKRWTHYAEYFRPFFNRLRPHAERFGYDLDDPNNHPNEDAIHGQERPSFHHPAAQP
jgi:tetratricopeptide (TPR) repeat protein